ncbi:MAG: DUF1501 domain-containing protein [Verrucomicrobiales bacterium]|nr:DUF1501 domain-containing protein [Verrucomicrobiales bacterium]
MNAFTTQKQDPVDQWIELETRRQFFKRSSAGLGSIALSSLIGQEKKSGQSQQVTDGMHFPAKAKRVIYLFMAGAPSQIDTFDYKPLMKDRFDQDLPESVRGNQRLTTMTSAQPRFPIAPSTFDFKQYGETGKWVSDLLPKTGESVDDLSFIHSMWTEAINHDPAITYIQTGNQIPGRPSLGAWVSYGLGSLNRNLPDFVVLNCAPRGQALFSRLWGSGFLPSKHAGVAFRSKGDPVLYLSNPSGMSSDVRRTMLDKLNSMNRRIHEEVGDPETQARISQYEMAFRMQSSVPDLVDIGNEPKHVLDMYGDDVETPGTFAHNCLMARRMAERDVRFVQIFHRGWDNHNFLPKSIANQAKEIDQPCHALIQDLKQRGLLKDTLVVWGGEFGRTIYSQGVLTKENHGRDHHPRCFTTWMAGGGIKPGVSYGETDEFSYNITQNPVHIRDLNATILHQLGIDHSRFSVRHLGLDQKLTGVEEAHVVKDILA